MATGRGGPVVEVFCPAHQDAPVMEDAHAGVIICSECGLVIGDRVIDVSREWSLFSKEEEIGDTNSRCGYSENDLLRNPQGQLSTSISIKLNKGRLDKNDLSLIHNPINSIESKVRVCLKTMNMLAARLSIAECVKFRCRWILKQLITKKLTRRMPESLVAACLFIACRLEKVPRTLQEIRAASTVKVRQITVQYKRVVRALNLEFEPFCFGDFINRFCDTLGYPRNAQRLACHIWERNEALKITNHCGMVRVGACLYMTAIHSGMPKNHISDIANLVEKTETTIVRAYRELRARSHEILPLECNSSGAIVQKA